MRTIRPRLLPARTRNHQMRGFWDDVLQIGEDAARKKLNDVLKTKPVKLDPTGHVLTDEQNRVVQVLLAGALDKYQAGLMSKSAAVREVRRIAAEYEEFAVQYGTRGRNGANDVNALVRQLVTDIGTDGGTPNGNGGRTGSTWLPSALSDMPWGWILAGGAVVYALSRR